MDYLLITFHPATTEVAGTTQVQSPIFDLSAYKTLHASLTVLNVSGAGQITCTLQGSMDGNIWRNIIAFPMIDVPSPPSVQDLTNLDRFIRANYAYGAAGSSVTFSLLGIAREY